MKLFWKAVNVWDYLPVACCSPVLIFTGCSSSSNDPIFSDNPTPPVMTGSPAAGYYCGAEVARFHVGDYCLR